MLYRAKGAFSLRGGNLLAQAITNKRWASCNNTFKDIEPDVYNQCRQLQHWYGSLLGPPLVVVFNVFVFQTKCTNVVLFLVNF